MRAQPAQSALMTPELQLTFRHMDTSPALAELCKERNAHLGRVLTEPARLHVTVELPHRHHTVGNELRVQLHAWVNGRELLVMEHDKLQADPQQQAAHVVKAAFATLERRLTTRGKHPTGAQRRHEANRSPDPVVDVLELQRSGGPARMRGDLDLA